ncbi:hypothetical protein MTO96_030845 [Rhipicephalus appendiculatus]
MPDCRGRRIEDTQCAQTTSEDNLGVRRQWGDFTPHFPYSESGEVLIAEDEGQPSSSDVDVEDAENDQFNHDWSCSLCCAFLGLGLLFSTLVFLLLTNFQIVSGMTPQEPEDDVSRDGREERAGEGGGGGSPPLVDQPITQIVIVTPPTNGMSVASILPNTVTAASNTSASTPTRSSQTELPSASPTTATTEVTASTTPDTATPAVTTPKTTTAATPATSVTQTTSRKRTTKLPWPAKKAYPLLCTVGAVSESTSLPVDGVCGVLFYESLYKHGLNNLSAGLGADVIQFISLTSHYASTALGASFDISPEEIDTEYTRLEFDAAVDSLWQKRISHFGALSSHVDNARITYIGKVLEMLKVTNHVISGLITCETSWRPKQTAARHVLTAIGVSPAHPADFKRIGELIDQTFAPDLFVAVSHLSIRDDDRPDCLILPPYHLHTAGRPEPYLRPYPGRYYAPKGPGSPDQTGGELRRLQAVRAEPRQPDRRTGRGVQGSADRSSGVVPVPGGLLRVDSVRQGNQHNPDVCASKGDAVTLRYGIAVYDVEDDGSPAECSQFTLRGQYCRLCMLRRLHDFISTNYTGAKLSKLACYRINPEMIDNSDSKCA